MPANIRFLDAFAALSAHELELWAKEEQTEAEKSIKVKIVRSGADINIKIDELAMRYITSRKNKIDVRGPVFMNVVAKTS